MHPGVEQVLGSIARFTEVCRDDARVVAAFLGGSWARGEADAWSDLDLGVIVTDEAYEEFVAECRDFLARLGEPLFLEHFGRPYNVFFILSDGTEGELAIGRVGDFLHIHGGPYRTLLDRQDVLAGVVFLWETADPEDQREELRRLVTWFWHDLSHFVTAIGRGQLWWAQGQLESLRRSCVDLLRLQANFSASLESYDKLDKAVPPAALDPLRDTIVPLDRAALVDAAGKLVSLFQQSAQPLAHAHSVMYPERLAGLMLRHFARINT